MRDFDVMKDYELSSFFPIMNHM